MRKVILATLAVASLCVLGTMSVKSPEVAAKAKQYKGFVYTVKGKTVTINEYKGKEKKVVIPQRISGKKVTKIKSFAFQRNRKVTSVQIPDTITDIGHNAFAGCSNLNRVKFSKNVKRIRQDLFANDLKLSKITGLDGVTDLSWATFEGCSSLKTISLKKVKNIPYRTFICGM